MSSMLCPGPRTYAIMTSLPSTPVMRSMAAGSRGALDVTSKPSASRKNATVRSRFDTVKLVWLVESTLKPDMGSPPSIR